MIPNLTSDGDNWVNGSIGVFKICAKVFSEPSVFGIKNGRISKLQVCDTSQLHWGFDGCYLNYDRGWDMRPKNEPERKFLNDLLTAFGDDIMEGDDYVWYDLYGYADQAAFDRLDREHLMSVDTKNEALEEAQGYIKHDDAFDIIKVRCSDDEDDDEVILKKDLTEKAVAV